MLLVFLIPLLVSFEAVAARAKVGQPCPFPCNIPSRGVIRALFMDKEVFEFEAYVLKIRRPALLSLWGGNALLFRIEVRPARHQIVSRLFERKPSGLTQRRDIGYSKDVDPGTYTNLRLIRSRGKLKIHYNKNYWAEFDRFSNRVDRISWNGFTEIKHIKRALSDYQCMISESPCGVTGNLDDVSSTDCSPRNSPNRIVGGTNARAGANPWQVAIRDKHRISNRHPHKCGGILIDSCWVLSAAHCFATLNPERKFIVRVGDYYNGDGNAKIFRLYESSQDLNIHKIIKHKDYNTVPSSVNDIALVKLQENKFGKCATFGNFVRPACLPTPEMNFPVGKTCVITGWGATESQQSIRDYPACLQTANVKLINKNECGKHYPDLGFGNRIYDHMVCAEGTRTNGQVSDACQGDSGGPLVCQTAEMYYAWGITSWGEGCGRKPGVFTKIAKFFDWMEDRLVEECDHDLIGRFGEK